MQKWFFVVGICLLATGCTAKKPEVVEQPEPARPAPRSSDTVITRPGGAIEESPESGFDPDRLLEACLPEEKLKQGWVRLFDGESLVGWFSIGNSTWSVIDHAITVDSGEPSFLCTSFKISDYELMVDFKCPASTNSGIFLRTTANPQDVASECYELNIAPADNPFPTGSLVKRKKVDPSAIGEIAPDVWHTYRAVVEGDSVKVWLDDKPVMEYTDPKKLRNGYISLQHNTGPVSFRNIFMRPLGSKPLPLGSQWESGWTKLEKEGAKMTVSADGQSIRIQGGNGQLESKEKWDDFVLQASYQLSAPEVNSGIFFRCDPGKLLEGYECQLNHAFKIHRANPDDWGAGGIFNRQKARIIVGDGTVPTYITILAENNQFMTWVNGLEVTDFADTREPNANPRRGSRREAGTIALQGHDDKTDVSFHSISVAPIEKNRQPN